MYRHEEKPVNQNARVGDVIVKVALWVGKNPSYDYYLVTGTPRNEGVIAIKLNEDLTSVVSGQLEAIPCEKLGETGFARICGYCVASIVASLFEDGRHYRASQELLRRALEANLFQNATQYEFLP